MSHVLVSFVNIVFNNCFSLLIGFMISCDCVPDLFLWWPIRAALVMYIHLVDCSWSCATKL